MEPAWSWTRNTQGILGLRLAAREREREREKRGSDYNETKVKPVSTMIVCFLFKIQVACPMSHPYLLRSAFSLLGPRGETPMQRLPLALALIVLFGAKIVIHTGNPEYLLTTVLFHFSCMGAPLMALYSLQYSILTFCVASDAPVFNTSIGTVWWCAAVDPLYPPPSSFSDW